MKRSREKKEKAIWFASWTKFVDDYKLRGQDPSTTYYGFFSTRQHAEDFISKKLWYIIKDLDIPDITKDMEWNYDLLSEILEEYLDKNLSEFIPCARYDWIITNIIDEIDDHKVKK